MISPRATLPWVSRRGDPGIEWSGPYGADLREPPEGPLYLYLTKADWARPWIEGGKIPLSPASKYLGPREGTRTPDEVRQERWDGIEEKELGNALEIQSARRVHLIGTTINGKKFGNVNIAKYKEDALLLCFSRSNSAALQERLRKKCCIEIGDISPLIGSLQNHYASVLHGHMRYTNGTERSHFMRSAEDQWMEEYRIVIPKESQENWIDIPGGVGRLTETN